MKHELGVALLLSSAALTMWAFVGAQQLLSDYFYEKRLEEICTNEPENCK